MIRWLVALLLAGVVSVVHGASASAADVKARLIGSWRLVSWIAFDEKGTSRPGSYDTGQVIYDASGQMSAHLMRASGRKAAAPTSDAERVAAYNSYLAYYGPFTIDEARGSVVHHVRGSSLPHWVGTDQVRYYTLSDNDKRLQLAVKNGERVTQLLSWERVE